MNTDDARLVTNAGYLIALLVCMRGGFALATQLIGLFREFLVDWRKVHGLKKDEPENGTDKPK